MTYAIEREEMNPHQSKEPLTKNRTYHARRWKAVRFVAETTEEEAEKYFNAVYGKDAGYRLVNWDNGEIIIDNGARY